MSSIYDWSTVAADNATSDSLINWNEGQFPSTVNGSARQLEARIAEFVGDIGGALTAGGTASAWTVTANSAFTAYGNGLVLALRNGVADNTGPTTLNVNGIGAKSIRKYVGGGDSALTGGELQGAGIYLMMYQTQLNASAGGWLVINPTTADPATYVTLTGSQTLTNKTLNGAVFNGTLGATTPSTVAGTTGTFSGAVSGTTGTFSGAVSGTTGTFTQAVTSSGTFIGGVQDVVLGTTGAGNISFRPNGFGSATNATTINSSGDVTVNGTLNATGGVQANGTALITAAGVPTATAALAVGAVGTYAMLLRTTTGTATSPGQNIAGSSLEYANPLGVTSGTSPAGTWQCVGFAEATGGTDRRTTVWKRVS